MTTKHPSLKHIRLTSHPVEGGHGALPIRWGRADPRERGPIVGSTFTRSQRNVIGTHSGSYSVYRALAVAASGDRLFFGAQQDIGLCYEFTAAQHGLSLIEIGIAAGKLC